MLSTVSGSTVRASVHGSLACDGVETALAVYGSLAPGGANHWVVSRLPGTWLQGAVRGWTFEITWGPAEGYDGFVPDSGGSRVPVYVLVGEALASKWREIDDFEGPGYRRVPIEVELDDGLTIVAEIYEALTEID